MARPLRIEFPGAVYHVVARGNEQRDVFQDDADRERYLARLDHYRTRFQFRVYAYCLMSNHVHLALEAGLVPLSRIMLCLQGSYTQQFNRRHSRVGHLFQGRYKAFLVDKDRYLLALIRYIHENPVCARLVRRPWQYLWSSDRWYRSGAGPDFLELDWPLGLFGRDRAEAVSGYRRFMDRQEGGRYEAAATLGQTIKGEEEFTARILREHGSAELARRRLSIQQIAELVTRSLGINPVTPLRRQPPIARALTAYIGRERGRIPLERSAEFFGRHGSTIVRDVRALEERLVSDRSLRTTLRSVYRKLS